MYNLNQKCMRARVCYNYSGLVASNNFYLIRPGHPDLVLKHCADVHTSSRTSNTASRSSRTGADPHKHQSKVRRLRKINKKAQKSFAGDWVAEDPMDLSPSTLPTINKQRLPASPLVDKNLVNNNKVAGGSSNKLAGKTASLLSAAESRSSSKVF